MLDRRQILKLVAGHCLLPNNCKCEPLPRSASPKDRSSCLVSTAEFARIKFLEKETPNAEAAVLRFRGNIIGASSNAAFDQELGASVLGPLAEEFRVNPGFGYYDEQKDTAHGVENALASPTSKVAGTSGTIVFGLSLLRYALSIPGGDFFVMAVCAHEFGHIKQFELNAHSYLSATIGSHGPELHADFLAGYFVRLFHERVPQAKLYEIGREWASLGHPTQIGGHGTSAQRVEAIEGGYDYATGRAKRSIVDAFEAGTLFVRKFRS